jgi:hypothetical protein
VTGFFGRGRASSRGDLDSKSEVFLERVRTLAARHRTGAPVLPGRSELAALVQAAKAALESEEASLRPRDSEGRPGGIVELPDLPTILVPDIHARPAFIASVLSWKPHGYGESVASLLERRRASLVCLGDVFHSEVGSARRRWAAAYREYGSHWASRASMDEEMELSLAAACIVLETKVAFPSNFHYLKGNHDNIADEEGRGDHSFYKFAVEGEMVASWFRATYGEALLETYRELELDLPLLALGSRFVASHGEPGFTLSRSDLIDYRTRPDVVEALIWTANGDAEAFSVAQSLDALLGPERAGDALWFAGHRPVDGRYALRAGGRFVQFHNPGAARVAILEPGRSPDPDRDIFDV